MFEVAKSLLSATWDAIDLTGELLRDPRAALGLARRLRDRVDEGLRILSAGAGGLAARELVNKSRVFLLVLEVGRILGVPAGRPFDLPRFVARAYRLDEFAALWAVEGLGHDYTASRWRGGSAPSGLLTRPPPLPARSLLMLHAGMGLAFAQRLLSGLAAGTPAARVRATVARFVELCRANSRPGYAGAALESLGLQTYAFHPESLTRTVHRALVEVSPDVVPYFWHGVGRAIYFDFPVAFLPCSAWPGFEAARRIAPDETAVLNAWAGLAWASTLVNQRQPEILASLLVGPYADALAANGAFANGVASSTLMRAETTPGAPFIDGFRGYRPPQPTVAAAWGRLVTGPCEAALALCHPLLEKEQRLDEIFRYRPAIC